MLKMYLLAHNVIHFLSFTESIPIFHIYLFGCVDGNKGGDFDIKASCSVTFQITVITLQLKVNSKYDFS